MIASFVPYILFFILNLDNSDRFDFDFICKDLHKHDK